MIPRFVVIDTETTGLGPDARILEVGMAFCEDGNIAGAWRQRFLPQGVDWNSPGVQQALSVNHINPQELVGEPDFADAAHVVELFLSRYKLWVGHNLPYDLRMLTGEFGRIGKQLPARVLEADTKDFSKFLDKGKKGVKHRLEDLVMRYGVKHANAHTAVGDAMATAEVFLRMVEDGRLPMGFMQAIHKLHKDEVAAKSQGYEEGAAAPSA